MAVVKGDLQHLGPLEIKVDSMLEKLSVLERLEKMVQRWEDSGRVTTSKQKKEKSIMLGDLKSGSGKEPLEESVTGMRPGYGQERWVDLNQKDPTRSFESGETRFFRRLDENNRVETLTRRLEMPIFEGWNPEGWVFRVERFFAAHGMSEGGEVGYSNHQFRRGGFNGKKVVVWYKTGWSSKLGS